MLVIIQVLNEIPRVNRDFTSTSSDLGKYKWFSCPGDEGFDGSPDDSCDMDYDFESACYLFFVAKLSSCLKTSLNLRNAFAVDDIISSPDGEDDPNSYIQSLLLYLALPIVLSLLLIFFVVLLVIFRCCCRCCIKGGTCGKCVPTYKGKCLGFQRANEGYSDEKPIFKYSRCSVWTTRALMLCNAGIILSFILVGEFKGNRKLTDGASSLALSANVR